jgi:co-chaperonin GroES (HSP10)
MVMIKYIPRNDFVLIRMVKRQVTALGVALPDKSRESTDLFIQAVGPDVTDLEIGDQVLAIGTPGEDLVLLPREKDLVMTKQANILCVVKEN